MPAKKVKRTTAAARSVPPRAPTLAESLDTPRPRLLLEAEVAIECRMTRTQIWKLEQADRFPRRRKYGFRRVAWLASEIDEWIAIGADAWVERQSKRAA